MKKVAVYTRVSKGMQHPENQLIALKKYINNQEGWNVFYFEEKESTRKTRPVKHGLYLRVMKKEFNTIVIWRLDRWARSLTELVLEITNLHNKGVNFISLSDNIDLDSASGKLQFQIMCAFAEFERAIISERTKEGLERARAENKHIGRPKGKKDSKSRRKSGYYQRWSNR